MSKLIAPPIPCTVEHITGIKPGQFGDYQSVLFKDAAGNKIWKSFVPGSPELAELPVGRRVYLVEAGINAKSGKMSHNVILMDEPTAPGPIAPTAPSPVPSPALSPAPVAPVQTVGQLNDDVKRAIAGYVVDSAKLYAFCFSEATRALESQKVSEETVRCAASSLFIAAQKKFGL